MRKINENTARYRYVVPDHGNPLDLNRASFCSKKLMEPQCLGDEKIPNARQEGWTRNMPGKRNRVES